MPKDLRSLLGRASRQMVHRVYCVSLLCSDRLRLLIMFPHDRVSLLWNQWWSLSWSHGQLVCLYCSTRESMHVTNYQGRFCSRNVCLSLRIWSMREEFPPFMSNLWSSDVPCIMSISSAPNQLRLAVYIGAFVLELVLWIMSLNKLLRSGTAHFISHALSIHHIPPALRGNEI